MNASTYDEALARVLAHEGGYVNHPADPGGPTNYGITLAQYSAFKGRKITAADVRAMPLADVKAIYRAKYWGRLRGDDLPAGLDYAVFDYGVNSGIGRAAKVLQRICGVADDGRLTDAVIAAVKKREAAELIARLCDERLAFLMRLKTWPTFGAGWRRRVAEVREAALRMARTEPVKKAPSPSPVARPSAPAPGKGVVPVNASARKVLTGGIVAAGTAAAHQAHQAGLHPAAVIAIVATTAALALAGWLAWHWWRRRRQEAPVPAQGPHSPPLSGDRS